MNSEACDALSGVEVSGVEVSGAEVSGVEVSKVEPQINPSKIQLFFGFEYKVTSSAEISFPPKMIKRSTIFLNSRILPVQLTF